MSKFAISVWFEIEAEDMGEAQEAVSHIGNAVQYCEEINCTDAGEIDVEEVLG